MSENFVLDSCAVIAYINGEQGCDIVQRILMNGEIGNASISMHKLNLLEVYYDTMRSSGEANAQDIVDMINESPVEVISYISDAVFKEAGRLKVAYKMSLADSVALAEAFTRNAAIVTADHHEFDIIERSEPIAFQWIR